MKRKKLHQKYHFWCTEPFILMCEGCYYNKKCDEGTQEINSGRKFKLVDDPKYLYRGRKVLYEEVK